MAPMASSSRQQLPTPFELRHEGLRTTFSGVEHALSTPAAPITQFRGVRYATIPGRFRTARLLSEYEETVDATCYGPVCPQSEPQYATMSDDGVSPADPLAQDELDCLNLTITCPRPKDSGSPHPVMVWIHGGGENGSSANWLYDSGALVHKSIKAHESVVIVNINFRIGVFGSAASPALRERVQALGDAGVGNYGLSDQRTALEWIQRNIGAFGGDATNVTLFGEGTGAADVLHHVHAAHGLFHRAIAQSPLGAPDADVASVHAAGWQLGKVGGALDALLVAPAEELVRLGPRYPVRAVDDPAFFPTGWRGALVRGSASQVPVLLGESSFAHLPLAENVTEWTAPTLGKRVGAVAQSRARAGAILRNYELSASTIPEELPERVLDLVGDARFAWPVEAAARRLRAAGTCVYRYTWDQAAPEHVAKVAHVPGDLAYLFDTLPALASDSPFDIAVFDDADDEELAESILSTMSTRSNSTSSSFSLWDAPPPVDRWSFAHVRDTLQERWLAFAHGAAPWAEDGVFVFGPEGECGIRSRKVFEGRRRVREWEEALAPLEMEVVQKLGIELANGSCA